MQVPVLPFHISCSGVVEHQGFAFGPAQHAVFEAQARIAVARHDQAEMAGDQALGRTSLCSDMRARRQDREMPLPLSTELPPPRRKG